MSEPRPFHHLFALAWMDLCRGSGIEVEEEKDLSHKKQFLDVVLRWEAGQLPEPLPDGFEEMAPHNLVTFKSHQEALDYEALLELVAHRVNYRKQVSPSMQQPLPASDFRLFAVCIRFPHNLASQEVDLIPLRPGVYEWRVALLRIRVIVVHQLPAEKQNAFLHLFSAKEDLLRYAREHYRPLSSQTSTLLYQLFRRYQEDPEMANQLDEFVRQSLDEILQKLPAEKRLEGLPPEERLKGLTPEQRLEGLSPEELRKHLSPAERLEGLSAEEVARALPSEVREALARQLKAHGSSAPQ